jgi:rfaE bifunctional protein nucleotidyltransferase chain/domain
MPRPELKHSDRSTRVKIRSIADLAEKVQRLRLQGRTVVLAHGVFDLIHVGHLYHLQEARALGDTLIVTVTADRYVNKGPGRPAFPAGARAEMLAALEIVDFVAINDAPGAEDLLHTIRPSIYFKGEEYRDAENDATGRILSERAAVEAHGGQLLFSSGPTFSSSALLNRHFDIYDPQLRSYLESVRSTPGFLSNVLKAIESVADMRVLLVGDAIIDEYNYVYGMGKAGKENIVVSHFVGQERFAGGVFAAANHVASFCKEVEIITCLGTEPSHENLIRSQLKPNVKLTPIYRLGTETTRKSRQVDKTYFRKIAEIYYADDRPLDDKLRDQFEQMVREHAGAFDAVIVPDFGHGLIANDSIESITRHARFVAVNTQTNGGNHGYNLITRYPTAQYVCIDASEAHLAVGDKYGDIEKVVHSLAQRIDCGRFIITRGEHGCLTYERGTPMRKVPAFTKTVVDTMGAGDAFLAITSPLVAAGVPLEIASFVGNAVGAVKVGIVGHRSSVEKPTLVKYITALLK